jgi:hypothetical protein
MQQVAALMTVESALAGLSTKPLVQGKGWFPGTATQVSEHVACAAAMCWSSCLAEHYEHQSTARGAACQQAADWQCNIQHQPKVHTIGSSQHPEPCTPAQDTQHPLTTGPAGGGVGDAACSMGNNSIGELWWPQALFAGLLCAKPAQQHGNIAQHQVVTQPMQQQPAADIAIQWAPRTQGSKLTMQQAALLTTVESALSGLGTKPLGQGHGWFPGEITSLSEHVACTTPVAWVEVVECS